MFASSDEDPPEAWRGCGFVFWVPRNVGIERAMAPAETIAGRYELENVLGRGGMGVVYRGRDRLLDRVVAVKVLPAQFASDTILVQRFEREARAVARLNHPNIVSIFDTGRDGTVRYIVMEFVSGESLAQRLSERGALPVSEAVGIAAQIADALAAAHAAGIVHRDIKPANVMIQPDGACKVLDFGIARAAAEAAMTQDASMLGSVLYMAPETALGQTADARSDIYSLGCVLYEMLTGELPFWGEVPAAVISQHVSAPPQPPRELAPSIPVALDALVIRMLAKDPAGRPRDASAAAAALRASLRTPPAPAAMEEVALAPTVVAPRAEAATRAEPPPPPSERSRFPAGLVGAAVLVALLVGVGIALAASSGSNHGTTSSATTASSTSSHRASTSTPTRASTSSSSSATPSTSTSTSTSTTTVTSSSPSTSQTRSSSSSSSTSSPSASSTASRTGP